MDAKLQYRIIDPAKAYLQVSDIHQSLRDRTAVELRRCMGSRNLTELLENKDVISNELMGHLQMLEEPWGVKIENSQINDIILDPTILRAFAVEEEARRTSAAKIINAQADVQTAHEYQKAAKVYQENELTIRLREFQLWEKISMGKASSLFVVPSSLLDKVSTTMHKVMEQAKPKA